MKKAAYFMICACVLGQSSVRADSTCLKFDRDGTVLTGLVFTRTYYGPPNYGEDPDTDTLETQTFLALDESICVQPGSSDLSDEHVSEQDVVTLVPIGKFDFSGYTGKRVSVTGSLFSANTGHHRTPVLISVQIPLKVLR